MPHLRKCPNCGSLNDPTTRNCTADGCGKYLGDEPIEEVSDDDHRRSFPGAPPTAAVGGSPARPAKALRQTVAGLHGVVLLLFFGTFSTYSCMGQEVARISGTEMAFGTTVEIGGPFGDVEEHEVAGSTLALLALGAALVGAVSIFSPARIALGMSAISGVVGAASLFILKENTTREVLREGEGLLGVTFTGVYWLALLVFVGATGLSMWRLAVERAPEPSVESPRVASAD